MLVEENNNKKRFRSRCKRRSAPAQQQSSTHSGRTKINLRPRMLRHQPVYVFRVHGFSNLVFVLLCLSGFRVLDSLPPGTSMRGLSMITARMTNSKDLHECVLHIGGFLLPSNLARDVGVPDDTTHITRKGYSATESPARRTALRWSPRCWRAARGVSAPRTSSARAAQSQRP